ncbi:MAG: glucokinase [Gammaproteobacteria bacterium]|nr:glucokinase [Gammaproteobacteria bacterium]MCD8525261.1 glucokinase [Gammaproteobacteria bacterium]MCD8543173.1 glucokinase [Gammaproteobacteria bacterium]
MHKTFVVWDLGATKCAAALIHFDVEMDKFNCICSTRVPLRDCSSLDELVTQIEHRLHYTMSHADAICIAAAGRYNGHHIELEARYPYPMDIARIEKQQQWKNIEIIHDYAAVACATFTSYLQQPANIKTIVDGALDPFGRRVVFGVGTGLGLKDIVLLANGDFWLGSNEAGHIGLTLPPKANTADQQRHNDFIDFLKRERGLPQGNVLTFEQVLSGRGVARIHHFLTGHRQMTPEEISHTMTQGKNMETMKMLAWYLGLFISTVQLMFMPSGGIWFTGGVILKNMGVCDQAELFEGIYSCPAYQKEREKFPLHVMVGPEYALMGCAYYASRRLIDSIA